MRPRHRRSLALAGCAALTLAAVPLVEAATAAPAPGHGGGHRDPARATLPAGDGWGAAEGHVTGGSAADAEHVYTVDTRAELVAALAAGDADTPRIIKVRGTIDANTDDEGNPLTCEDYATDGYTLQGYLDAYDPETWGVVEPSGPMEEARLASAANQAERVRLSVGSNTTLVGLGDDATLLGATVDVRDAENVIIRNLTFEDAYDCFPQWDPTDGEFGEWNSEYDNLVVYGSRRVWVDHNTLTDGRRPDAEQPRYFGRLYQQHDGLFDIVRGADLVTVSWNVMRDHSKTILLGNSDGAGATDRGRLRVTFHHNLFENLGERVPRVRFGQVDVYNNHFRQAAGSDFGYTWGIGFEAQLVAEHNAFSLPAEIDPAEVIHRWSPNTAMTESGNIVNGRRVDLLGAYNEANPEALLGDDAGWVPELRTRVDSPWAVPGRVQANAGAGELRGLR
ncbi:pectate lyase family protein [Streptomyces sp. 4N509B]|uniref:pectate lyase family protein n=1 Tax=Streptomyces sp. 4N509B TaxID=3457413 RepID=UPI003FD378F5